MNESKENNYSVGWYRVPLPKELRRELNARSDVKGFMQAGGYLGLMFLSGLGVFLVWQNLSWPWLIPALFIHGTICSFQINAVHELVHGTVFKTKWLNTLFVHFFAFFGWINHRFFWASHTEHHKYTLHDPHDMEVVLPIKFSLSGFMKGAFINIPGIQWKLKRDFKTACGMWNNDWEKQLCEGQKRRHAICNWSRILIGGHLLIAVVSIYFGLWIVPIIVSLNFAYGGALLFFLNNTQHVGLQDHTTDFRLNSRTFYTNPVFRFLYWNMNYHIEHHMYASVPCYNLSKLHEAIKSELPPTPNGLIQTWFHIIGVLYRQQEEPGYQYEPKIPESEFRKAV
ncbi:fatty acid desaturase [Rubellicoccus peritrichatus]|uniref:Fatty acid desaturase n=1 Tax=Rubellicoccus peritrichatus TaxID=3080537 RepID=A0AAQ3L8L7_9BACT|nr:fatty acid desaturase [Puniceicoccus sp. CR14]WOO39295.1 fatty acid desaturase [Puniceicoccus sp. CR14]